jgi:hypothetical protein
VATITLPSFWLPSVEAVSKTVNSVQVPENNWRPSVLLAHWNSAKNTKHRRPNHVKPLFGMD